MFVAVLALTVCCIRGQDEWVQLDRDLGSARVTALYAVHDLIDARARDFIPPELGTSKLVLARDQAEPAPPQPAEPTLEDRVRATEAFGALLMRHVQPPIDPAVDKLASVGDGTLAIHADVAKHEWIGRFLAVQRHDRNAIQTEARLFTFGEDALKRLRIQNGATLASQRELDDFVARCTVEPGVEQLTAPRTLSWPRQRASIAVLEPFTYVKDWKLEIVEPGAKEIADPEIAVIQEGLVLDVRAMPFEGGRFLCELGLQRCEVQRPVPTAKVRVGKAQYEVEVALPQADTVKFSSDALLADGASIVWTSAGAKNEKVLVAVVTVRGSAMSEGAPAKK